MAKKICVLLLVVSVFLIPFFFGCEVPESSSIDEHDPDLDQPIEDEPEIDFEEIFVIDAPDTSLCSVRGNLLTDRPLFSWASVSGATSYTLYVIDVDNQSIVLKEMNLMEDDIAYEPRNPLPMNIPLRWKMKGENPDGTGPYSTPVDFMITSNEEAYSVTGNPPLFRWPAVNQSGYWLLVGDSRDLGSSTWIIDERELTSNSYQSNITFPSGSTFYWKVKFKVGAFEDWYWSAIRSFTIPGAPSAPSRRELAEYYAPVIFQDVDTEGKCDHADNGRSDYITKINFDGDWLARNNWENEPDYPLKAYVYYSVVESNLRYYITYAIFHPRDFKNSWEPETEHENDMEGLWMTVYKDGTWYGSLEAMVTVAHLDFYQYSNYEVGERESKDGPITLTNGKPTIYIQCRGHGIKGKGSSSFGGDDGVVYKYSGTAQQPNSPTSHLNYSTACTYDLVHIDELWERRPGGPFYASGTLYHSLTSFLGDSRVEGCGCSLKSNSPHPPWGWDDWNDGDEIQAGKHFTDPSYYFDYTLALEKIPGHLSPRDETYFYNPYSRP
ncbi:MAG: hypothetical protein JXJ04_16510 [Spirochaetales bacterium]|nr:hypothetical protein [Spirochaetales bacterium]